MITIGLNNNTLRYRYLQEMAAPPSKAETAPYYIFDRYGVDFLDRLYMLQSCVTACHALVLFEPRDTEKVLRHINILDGFTFTLVPTEIDPEVYGSIYEFFMHSRLSTSYITWISKLLLRPHREVGSVTFNDIPVEYAKCQEICPMRVKDCSKGLLFTELFHPMKEFPTDDDFRKFCAVHKEYSLRIVQDYLNSDLDLPEFSRIRRNFGIRNQYWIDPQRIFVGEAVSKEAIIQGEKSWLQRVGQEEGNGKPVDAIVTLLDTRFENSTPTVEVGFTAFDRDSFALVIDRNDEAEGDSLAKYIDAMVSEIKGPSLHELSSAIVSSDIVQNYPLVKMDCDRYNGSVERVSIYYRFSERLRGLGALRDLFEARPFEMIFVPERLQPYLDLAGKDIQSAGFTLKVRPTTGEQILRLWVNIPFKLAFAYAMVNLSDAEKENTKAFAPYIRKCYPDRLDSVFMGVDAASNRENSPLVFSIDVPDITGAELVELLAHFGDVGADEKRIQLLAGDNWRNVEFDYVKFRPVRTGEGVSIKYSLSYGKTLPKGSI
ncbi:MAG: hypothetical protein M0Z67_02140 [Nitrospiraceae bacterium]|nr:hypothetical protein [Nitrospiraceae bacterium]